MNIQCPISKHLNKEEAFEKIDKNKDIDCFNPYNIDWYYWKE